MITGADPAFCSGDDVKQIMAGAASGGRRSATATPRLTPAADALLHTDVPVIAAVNGAAVGWGMELALMADIRVASERARFGELFVKRGLCSRRRRASAAWPSSSGGSGPPSCSSPAEVIDADEAQRIGLVSRVVPHDELLPTALGAGRARSPPTRRSPCSA